jgi:hypothetical protein
MPALSEMPYGARRNPSGGKLGTERVAGVGIESQLLIPDEFLAR